MSERKHLQEIYGEEDTDNVRTEHGIDFNKLINQLKKRFGDDWHKHVDEYVDELSGEVE